MAAGAGAHLIGCGGPTRVASSALLGTQQLPQAPTPWPTPDPFLFCVHHDDAYPLGNEVLGPAAPLDGRQLGMDFAGRDGWRMYHGQRVPRFPQHPHRGFETVTVVRRGLLDHSDSLGAAARYGRGDVQWLTAGAGIQHAEMFPLLERSTPNPVELFQIWLNLPGADKFAQPHFSMLWDRVIPRITPPGVRVTVVAGELAGARAAAPPPSSWASRKSADVAIWTIQLDRNARWTLPAASAGANRWLYHVTGGSYAIDGAAITPRVVASLRSDVPALLDGGNSGVELLMLQGQPIGEPVVKRGPFVMNTKQQIHEAIHDFQTTQFGGWSWASNEPVHPRDAGRFARRPDGTMEKPA
ncbi:MAG: pirin family protein [Deltaproteobacteria bacterium]|nr:pirin family protein [Deltaproteobacteria bacterium]